MPDISSLSTSLVGVVSPFLTQVIRDRWVKVNDAAAHWLSLAAAAGCVGVATWINHAPFDLATFGSNIGLAFTLSQIVYHNMLRESDNSRGLVVTDPVVTEPAMVVEDVDP